MSIQIDSALASEIMQLVIVGGVHKHSIQFEKSRACDNDNRNRQFNGKKNIDVKTIKTRNHSCHIVLYWDNLLRMKIRCHSENISTLQIKWKMQSLCPFDRAFDRLLIKLSYDLQRHQTPVFIDCRTFNNLFHERTSQITVAKVRSNRMTNIMHYQRTRAHRLQH